MPAACITLAVSTILALAYVLYLKRKCAFFMCLSERYRMSLEELKKERKNS